MARRKATWRWETETRRYSVRIRGPRLEWSGEDKSGGRGSGGGGGTQRVDAYLRTGKPSMGWVEMPEWVALELRAALLERGEG